jgi:hypothetical protein
VSEAEETVLLEALREDFHDIFAFALLSGIRETGLCTMGRSKVDLANAQVMFRSKRHRDDPPGLRRKLAEDPGLDGAFDAARKDTIRQIESENRQRERKERQRAKKARRKERRAAAVSGVPSCPSPAVATTESG